MKTILKSMWVSIPNVNLENYFPDDLECFGLWINLTIGPDDVEGGHDYQILVCTPDWIKKEYGWKKSVLGRHMLIIFEYDLIGIKAAIDSFIDECQGKDFWEAAQKISRFAAWEFEDYQP